MEERLNTVPETASLWQRLRRYWFGYEPMRHHWWETFLMRVGVALIVWPTIGGTSRFTSQPVPHGMAAPGWNFAAADGGSFLTRILPGMDFTWIGSEKLIKGTLFTLDLPGLPAWDVTMLTFWALSLVLYALGVFPVITIVPALVASVAHGVLGNSQGAIGHTTQIVSVTLLAIWLAAVWGHLCQAFGWRRPHGLRQDQMELDWARQSVMATYVASALTKVYESGGNWMADTPYFGLQIAKSTDMAYYTHLVPADNAVWLAQYFVDHPLVAQIALGAGLPLELFAFFALLNRRIALVYGLALITFHQTVTEVMNLGFLYHKQLLLVLFVNPVFWAWMAGDWVRRRFGPGAGSVGSAKSLSAAESC